MGVNLHTTYVNGHSELFPYLLTHEEGNAIRELLSWYFPNGPVRFSTIYHGGAGLSGTVITNSSHLKLNHVIQHILGIPSLDTGLDTSVVAGGKGFDISSSFLSSLGESVERISGALALLREDLELVYGSYKSVVQSGRNALSPEKLFLFSEEQYSTPDFLFQRFTRDTELGWVKGRQLLSNEEIWLPAQVALFFYTLSPEETLIGYSASSGMACHINRAMAIIGGVTEIAERDAIMLSWYSGIPPCRLILDRPMRTRRANSFLRHLNSLPGQISFWLHDVGIPRLPVITAFQLLPNYKKFAYYVGAASAMDGEEAFLQALVEYGQSEIQLKLANMAPKRRWTQGVRLLFDVPPDKPVHEITTFLETLGYYGHPENSNKVEEFFSSDKEVLLSELPEVSGKNSDYQLSLLKEILREQNIDPIIIDFTPSQMKQVSTIKVFIPELMLPHVSSNPYLGHPRLFNIPRQTGLVDEPLTYGDLNAGPVPFP